MCTPLFSPLHKTRLLWLAPAGSQGARRKTPREDSYMKKLALVVALSVFAPFALSACGNPCEKAFDKMVKCMEEKKIDKEIVDKFKKKKSKFVEDCKKEGDMGKVKDCLSKDCKDFRKCIRKANK